MRQSRRSRTSPVRARLVGLAALVASFVACGDDEHRAPSSTASAVKTSAPDEGIAPPLPTGGPAPSAKPIPTVKLVRRCPTDMVKIGDAFCIDRYEDVLVDFATGAALSPYYPPERQKAAFILKMWTDKRGTGNELERATPLPSLAPWETQKTFYPRAVSKKGAIPQGYASGRDAEVACKNAGKRLCERAEWKTACRGEQDRDFPYGDTYERGRCNVFGDAHPGVLLWDDPTINHTDPRFNLMKSPKGAPLLHRTGTTPDCVSKWGDDAVYDMVGNIDEWIDDPEGTFLGGFYARAKKDGCQSAVEAHPYSYADYSTGVRCCMDLPPAAPEDAPVPSAAVPSSPATAAASAQRRAR
jgi:formylglycine-generating enzyme required for sulfatase activity